jgi:hypothetical protein
MTALTLYRRYRIQLFWILLVIIYGLAIMPGTEAPTIGFGDKADHMFAFLVLTLLGRAVYGPRRILLLGIGLSAFGAFIELSQGSPFIGRDASMADWIADSFSILLGLGLGAFLAKRLPLLF